MDQFEEFEQINEEVKQEITLSKVERRCQLCKRKLHPEYEDGNLCLRCEELHWEAVQEARMEAEEDFCLP